MAETSYLWDNPNTGDSPALGYGNALLNQVIFRMMFNGTGNQGVLLNWLNDLEVTDGGGLNATVDTGGAFSYGVWFENDAAVNVAIGNNTTEWVVVRASWAAQTARLTAIAPGAFTQNPGVTYDVPVAQVTTVAGAITLIVDVRDYCEFSTEPWPFVVDSDAIQADAATIAKVIDQDRWLDLGHGCMEADVANAATWASHIITHPYADGWDFDPAALTAIWVAFLVPADFTGANATIVLRNTAPVPGGAADVRWLYNAEVAAASAVFANQAGNALQTLTYNVDAWNWPYSAFTLCTLAVTAGDLVLLRISRDGAHGGDTFVNTVTLMQVCVNYTADS